MEKVLDGDTLWVNINIGFNIRIREKVRLYKIDIPEIDKIKGLQAKNYVNSQLKPCDFIIIKTHGRDKFDRCLVDIYYKKTESDPDVVAASGTYLNQRLLDKRHAVAA